jgi:hypothetical protein
MINRHNTKAYILANGWTYIPSNLAEGEEFVKGKYRISIPTVDDLDDVFMDDLLTYNIDQICRQEKTSLLSVINNIANTWLPFDPANIPTPNQEYMLLLKEGGYGNFFTEYTSCNNNGKLYWHACYGDDHLDEKRANECYGATYKLIKI